MDTISQTRQIVPTSSSANASRSTIEGFMPRSMLHRTHCLHPLTGYSRKMRVAESLHVSVALADKYLYGETAINRLYAAILASDLRAGDLEAVAQWVAPAEAVQADAAKLTTDTTLYHYDCADVAEDAAQAELRRKPVENLTDSELETYIRAVAREAYRATQALAALHRERADRKARS